MYFLRVYVYCNVYASYFKNFVFRLRVVGYVFGLKYALRSFQNVFFTLLFLDDDDGYFVFQSGYRASSILHPSAFIMNDVKVVYLFFN